jgi:pimeloyl-ACP methyl ester carboxylesterase
MPNEILASYTATCGTDAGVRRDLRRFLRGVHRRYTLAAAQKFGDVKMPVLVVSTDRDRLFPLSLAERLEKALPDARRVTVTDSYTFVPEDQPAELARLVVDFLRTG